MTVMKGYARIFRGSLQRVIRISKDTSSCLDNGFCLCSIFCPSSNFYLEKGFTLCCPLSHVVKNSCPMGCLELQLLRPLVTEVAATKGSLGDRDLEKKKFAWATILWPFHRWSAHLFLIFISLIDFQRYLGRWEQKHEAYSQKLEPRLGVTQRWWTGTRERQLLKV